jgi:hypothetical protein
MPRSLPSASVGLFLQMIPLLVDGNFAAIQIIADTVFNTLTALNSTVGGLAGA